MIICKIKKLLSNNLELSLSLIKDIPIKNLKINRIKKKGIKIILNLINWLEIIDKKKKRKKVIKTNKDVTKVSVLEI